MIILANLFIFLAIILCLLRSLSAANQLEKITIFYFIFNTIVFLILINFNSKLSIILDVILIISALQFMIFLLILKYKR